MLEAAPWKEGRNMWTMKRNLKERGFHSTFDDVSYLVFNLNLLPHFPCCSPSLTLSPRATAFTLPPHDDNLKAPDLSQSFIFFFLILF
ncbi:hypothetical protein VNO80_30500 [Phaseolus coccineus]|uniref:Uncharacterized protein n=1 Tax=Phaseolus coccineus TaxID=3886 RepID=A0AAN9QJJ8_PHACN